MIGFLIFGIMSLIMMVICFFKGNHTSMNYFAIMASFCMIMAELQEMKKKL